MKVLITGASRGIGRACAERFAAAGHRVTAVARSASQLQALASRFPATDVRAADLTVDSIEGTFDVVVLNAGVYAPGTLLDPARDVFGESFALNVLANHRLARTLLPPMIARGSGHLVVIGSTATDDTSPHMTAYAATKKALRGLWEGWQADLDGTGVLTALIAPGATVTSSWEKEDPPPHALQPAAVAELVYRVVAEGLAGRHVLRGKTPGA